LSEGFIRVKEREGVHKHGKRGEASLEGTKAGARTDVQDGRKL